MNNWNGFDFFIFLIFALNTILGMSRGALKEIISMMCLSVALIFTIKFTIPLTNFFNSSPLIVDVVSSPIIQNFMQAIGAGPLTANLLFQIFYAISLLICFVGVFSICEGALSMAGVEAVFSFPYAAINRKLGATLGCTRGYVISIIFISICTLHVFAANNQWFAGSFFVNLLGGSAQQLDQIISGQKPEDYTKIYQGKDIYKSTDVIKNMSN